MTAPRKPACILRGSGRPENLCHCGAKFPSRKRFRKTGELMRAQEFLNSSADHIPGHKQHPPGGGRIRRREVFEETHAVQSGNFPIPDDHVEPVLTEDLERFLATQSRFHRVSLRPEPGMNEDFSATKRCGERYPSELCGRSAL